MDVQADSIDIVLYIYIHKYIYIYIRVYIYIYISIFPSLIVSIVQGFNTARPLVGSTQRGPNYMGFGIGCGDLFRILVFPRHVFARHL